MKFWKNIRWRIRNKIKIWFFLIAIVSTIIWLLWEAIADKEPYQVEIVTFHSTDTLTILWDIRWSYYIEYRTLDHEKVTLKDYISFKELK